MYATRYKKTYLYLFDVRVRLTLPFWMFWANFADVNTSVWTPSETLDQLLTVFVDGTINKVLFEERREQAGK